ncbi:MAG: hypothetical protein ACXW0T_13055 [Methylobacter sp.]
MGEAKRRGSQAERVKQALESYTATPIEAVKEELGLPDTAEFLGYVIHLPDKDEFLGDVKDNAAMKSWAWVKTPELALRFDDFKKAVKERQDCKGNPIIALLFDVDDKYFVGWTEE